MEARNWLFKNHKPFFSRLQRKDKVFGVELYLDILEEYAEFCNKYLEELFNPEDYNSKEIKEKRKRYRRMSKRELIDVTMELHRLHKVRSRLSKEIIT